MVEKTTKLECQVGDKLYLPTIVAGRVTVESGEIIEVTHRWFRNQANELKEENRYFTNNDKIPSILDVNIDKFVFTTIEGATKLAEEEKMKQKDGLLELMLNDLGNMITAYGEDSYLKIKSVTDRYENDKAKKEMEEKRAERETLSTAK